MVLALGAVFPCLVGAAPGDLDPTFARHGIATTRGAKVAPFGETDAVLQPDGKIVVAGETCTSQCGSGDLALVLARFNPNGSLDRTFSHNGVFRTPAGFLAEAGCCHSIGIQPDGRIIAVGGGGNHFTISSYTADGQIDRSFGAGGIVEAEFDDGGTATDIAVLEDGRFVVAGYQSDELPPLPGSVGGAFDGFDMALARFMPDGSLDPRFAGDGASAYDFGESRARALTVQPDGRIVVVGNHFGGYTLVARVEPDGELDSSFAGDGIVADDFGGFDDVATSVALDPAGRLVVAINHEEFLIGRPTERYAVARYLPDGSLDSTFSGDGVVGSAFGVNEYPSEARDVAILPDGRVVVVGTSLNTAGPNHPYQRSISAARFTSNGTPDRKFGIEGSIVYNFGRQAYGARALVGSDGLLRVVGEIVPYTAEEQYFVDLAVLRTLGGGRPDLDADGRGDPRDRCPKRFGRRHGGCPRHARSVSFDYLEKLDYLVGEIDTPEEACAHHEEVVIFRSLLGPDERVRSTISHDSADGFYFTERLPVGHYYAVVVRTERRSAGICAKAVSPLVRIGGR
jgi:uncharacterized delta-60 repeat protein